MTSLNNKTHNDRNLDIKGKFLVIGCGSIGKRHIKNLLYLGIKNIIAFDTRNDRLREMNKEFKIETFARLENALADGVNFVLICTPTSLHIPNALLAARKGCHLFIEKPLSDSLNGIDELIKEVEHKNLITLVACNYRFHPGLQKVKKILKEGIVGNVLSVRAQYGQYLPDCRPWEDYRLIYSAYRCLGGGIILDRIHELDYLRWLFGEVKEIFCLGGHFSKLEIDTEDIAEIILQFENGAVASVHLDYVRRTYDCSLEIIGEQGIIQWCYQDNNLRWYTSTKSKWEAIQWKNYNGNEMYIEEMRHFLRILSGKEESIQDIKEGKKVLEIALAAKRSMEKRKIITL